MTLETMHRVALAGALYVGLYLFATPDFAQTAAREAADDRSIQPFKVDVPQSALDDLRRRVRATRWADKETVTDRSQGTQLAQIQELVRHWGTDYDWRK